MSFKEAVGDLIIILIVTAILRILIKDNFAFMFASGILGICMGIYAGKRRIEK